jgi:hypothetical protein
MNKLQGFYELHKMGIPAISWKQFTGNDTLDPALLWTVRVAVQNGFDFNLPRAVGVSAEEAVLKANHFSARLSPEDLVIYYPYFVAVKSGILEIQEDQTIIEAVDKDLWNLTTHGKRDLTIVINRHTGEVAKYGNADFLDDKETSELIYYAQKIRNSHRKYIFAMTSLLLEWHYALHTNANGDLIGEKYLVFTECKTVGSTE